MANISISDIRPAGSQLFVDSESFMNDLADQELSATNGGLTPGIIIWGVPIASKYVVSAMVTGAAVGAYSALKK